MRACRHFGLLCLHAGWALIKDRCLSVKFGDAINEFVRITETFIARMPWPLVPEKLFSSSSDCMHRNRLINDSLESCEVDAQKFVRRLFQHLIELEVFIGFCMCNF